MIKRAGVTSHKKRKLGNVTVYRGDTVHVESLYTKLRPDWIKSNTKVSYILIWETWFHVVTVSNANMQVFQLHINLTSFLDSFFILSRKNFKIKWSACNSNCSRKAPNILLSLMAFDSLFFSFSLVKAIYKCPCLVVLYLTVNYRTLATCILSLFKYYYKQSRLWLD